MAFVCLGTFLCSLLAVRVFLLVSRRRLLDRPGARSSHAHPTPTGGGFPAVLVGLAACWLAVGLSLTNAGPRWWALLLTALVLSVLGLADDARDLPRAARYSAHVLVGIGSVVLLTRGAPGDGLFAATVGALAVLLVTGLINAVNFMDGIDALVGSTGCIILGFLGWQSRDPVWFVFAAAYAGFLAFNLPPARLFMGDAGSTTLGGLIGVALLAGRHELLASDLVVLAPLLGDAAYTLLRRLLRRENVVLAHHSHLYQRLLRAGSSHGRISLGYAVATLASAWLAWALGSTGALIALVACAVLVLVLELHLARKGVPFTRRDAIATSEARH